MPAFNDGNIVDVMAQKIRQQDQTNEERAIQHRNLCKTVRQFAREFKGELQHRLSNLRDVSTHIKAKAAHISTAK